MPQFPTFGFFLLTTSRSFAFVVLLLDYTHTPQWGKMQSKIKFLDIFINLNIIHIYLNITDINIPTHLKWKVRERLIKLKLFNKQTSTASKRPYQYCVLLAVQCAPEAQGNRPHGLELSSQIRDPLTHETLSWYITKATTKKKEKGKK